MLLGEFETNLGQKNRIAIPKRLRQELMGRIYITRGYDGCGIIMDQQRWDALLKNINNKSILTNTVREVKRFVLGGALEIELDDQGRFVVPESIRIFTGITDKVVFVGIGEWIEIWDHISWSQKLQELSRDFKNLSEDLST